MYICIYVHIYICTHIHICTYIHIYIYTDGEWMGEFNPFLVHEVATISRLPKNRGLFCKRAL